MPGTRTQNVIVAALATLAVGASGYAVWSVGRPHPSLGDHAAAPGSFSSSGGRGTVLAPPPSGEATAATEAAEPADQATGGVKGRTPSVGNWLSAWSGEADLLVIGDGFSNMPDQWVQLWAAHLGYDRPVQIHHWGEAADVAFNDPIVLSDTGDSPLTVWSASRAEMTIHEAAERYKQFVEAAASPDAVLITLGRSSASEDIGAGLDVLVDEIDDDVSVLLSIGPEGLYEEGVGDALLAWAQDNDDRLSVVDLRDMAPVAPTAEQWAQAFQRALNSG